METPSSSIGVSDGCFSIVSITLHETFAFDDDDTCGVSSVDDSLNDFSLTKFMLLDRRFMEKGFLDSGDSFGDLEDCVFFAATGVVLLVILAGDFLGFVDFLGDGDFDLVWESAGMSSLALLDVSESFLPRLALVGVFSEADVFFGIGILIAKLAGFDEFASDTSLSRTTMGLFALRFEDDFGVRLGVGVFFDFGDFIVGPFEGVSTCLDVAFGVFGDFGSSGSLRIQITDSFDRSSSRSITSLEVRTFSFESSILFTFAGRLLSSRAADSLRFRVVSVGVKAAAGNGAKVALADGVTLLKGKRAWTSFLPTGETLGDFFFILAGVGIAGDPGTRR